MTVVVVILHVVVYGQRVSSGSWAFSTLYLLRGGSVGYLNAFFGVGE